MDRRGSLSSSYGGWPGSGLCKPFLRMTAVIAHNGKYVTGGRSCAGEGGRSGAQGFSQEGGCSRQELGENVLGTPLSSQQPCNAGGKRSFLRSLAAIAAWFQTACPEHEAMRAEASLQRLQGRSIAGKKLQGAAACICIVFANRKYVAMHLREHMRWEESQSELPHLQLALVEAERKRQALQEEIKAGSEKLGDAPFFHRPRRRMRMTQRHASPPSRLPKPFAWTRPRATRRTSFEVLPAGL